MESQFHDGFGCGKNVEKERVWVRASVKIDGRRLEANCQECVLASGLSIEVTVVSGPRGSY